MVGIKYGICASYLRKLRRNESITEVKKRGAKSKLQKEIVQIISD